MARFIGELVVKLITDDAQGLWEHVQPLSFQSDVAGRTIIAPVGHRTDFMTVPRVPFIFDKLGNRGRRAGTIHDRLYITHEVDRELADRVLREMLLVDGFDHADAEACYLAVREFGGSHW